MTDETKKLDDQAFWSKVKDVVTSALANESNFIKHVEKLQMKADRKIEAPLEDIVEVTSQNFGFSDKEKEGVLKSLINLGDLTQYGLKLIMIVQLNFKGLVVA